MGDTSDLEEVTFTLLSESTKGRMYQKRKIGKLSSFFAVNLKYPDLVLKMFRYEDPRVEEPEIPDDLDENNVAAQIRYREDIKEVSTKKKNLESSKFTIFEVIWGQCSVALQNKLMMIDYFERALESSDCTWLLMNIRSITYNFSSDSYVFQASVEATTKLMNFKQGGLSLREYYECFEELKEAVIFGNGGGLTDHPNLLRHIEANEPDDLRRLYPGVKPRMPSIPPDGSTEAELLEYIEDMVEYRGDYRDYNI